MKKLLIGTALTTSVLFAGSFARLEITDSTIFTKVQTKISNSAPIYARAGYLAINKGKDTNEEKYNFGYVGLRTEGKVAGDDSPVTASLFIDGVYTKDNSATPIGIGISSYIPQIKIPTFIRGEVEYAPDILSYQDANRFLKGQAEVGVQFIKNAEVFVGYRNISFNHLYHNAVYIGAGMNF